MFNLANLSPPPLPRTAQAVNSTVEVVGESEQTVRDVRL